MTDTTALRDELAGLLGYEPFYEFRGAGTWNPPGDKSRIVKHPFPDGDLTALAEAWPEGWGITLNKNYANGTDGQWYGVALCIWGPRPLHREELTVPTEYEARLSLTVAVLKAAMAANPTT